MSEFASRRSGTPKFSLRNLLLFTAFTAVGTAFGLAYQKNHSMQQYRDDLLALSSRLQIASTDELASASMPNVADDFYSWQLYVPKGKDYELKLGIGAISENGIPPVVGSVRVPAGRHRVTLHTADSPNEEFLYAVYIDGNLAIEHTMGRDWIPGGWSSASGMSWPRGPNLAPTPLQLSAKSYQPKVDFGNGYYFNGQSDAYVTRSGYRLWVDQSDRAWMPASPFMGFPHDPQYQGIGLRDGLRYRSFGRQPYLWTFTRPKSETEDPVLSIAAEFVAEDGTILSSDTPSFRAWQLRNQARGEEALNWQAQPASSTYSAFLHAQLDSDDGPQPIVEMKWDVERPNQVGLRIAESPANERFRQWRLRIFDGTKHLWRELQIGERIAKADELIETRQGKPADLTVPLDLAHSGTAETRLRWQTDESLPLQAIERKQKNYAGLKLYKGLPVTFGIEIPTSLQPTVALHIVKDDPRVPGNAFPGGSVVDEIEIELDATSRDWLWLEVESKAHHFK